MPNKVKILMLEDRFEDIKLAEREFQINELEYQLETVDNEEGFRNLLNSFKPDIIISDYSLPGYDGLLALEYCIEKYPDIPFIICTGSLDEETAVQTMKMGACDYILKENLIRLVPAIKKCLKLRKEKIAKKKALENLKQNERKYRMVTENAKELIIIHDLQGNIKFVNKAAVDIMGFARNYFYTKKVTDFLAPEYIEEMKNRSELRHKGKTKNFLYEVEVIAKNGERIPLEISSTYEKDEQQIGKIILIGRDLRERKEAQEQIRKTHQYYKALIDKAPDGIAINDKKLRLKYASPGALKQFGYKAEDLIGHSGGEFTHPEDVPKVREVFEKILAHPDEQPTIQYRFKNKSGNYRWVETTFTNLLDDSVINGFVLNFKDITERKKAQDRIKESEFNLRSLFNAMEDVIIELDKEGNYLTIAPTSGKYTPNENLIGKNIFDVFSENQAKQFLQLIQDSLKQQETLKIEYPDEIDDRMVWFEARISPKREDTVLFIARDITEKIIAQSNLRDSEQIYRYIYDSTLELLKTEDLEKIKEIIVRNATKLLNAKDCILYQYDEQEEILKPVFTNSEKYYNEIMQEKVKIGEGISGLVAKTGSTQYVNYDIPESVCSRHIQGIPKHKDKNLSLISASLTGGEGLVGVITIAKEKEKFDDIDITKLNIFSRLAEFSLMKANFIRELQQSEEKYKTIFENSGTANCIIEADKTLSLVNEQFCKLTGYNQQELENKMKWTDFVIEKDLKKMEHYHNNRREKNKTTPNKYEFRFKDRLENIHHILLFVDMLPDTKKSIASLMDITEIKRAENLQKVLLQISNAFSIEKDVGSAFRSLKKYLKRIIDTENLYIAFYDEENDKFDLPYHHDEKEFRQSFEAKDSLTKYVMKKGKPMLAKKADIKKLADEGKIKLIGSLAKVWVGVPLKVEDNVIGVMAIQDYQDANAFTEKDKHLLEIVSHSISRLIQKKQIEEALRKSEEHMRSIIENAQEYAIFRYKIEQDTKKLKIKIVSPSACKITGLCDEKIYNYRNWIKYIHPKDKFTFLRKSKKAAEKYPYSFDYTCRYNHPEKGLRWIHVRSQGITNKNNQVEYVNGIIQDVTSMKENEKLIFYNNRIFKALAGATSALLKTENYKERLDTVFAILGSAMQINRINCFKIYKDSKENQKEIKLITQWHNREKYKYCFEEKKLKYSKSIYNQLDKNELVYGLTRCLPEEDKDKIAEEGIVSLAIVPIFVFKKLWGSIELANCEKDKEWGSIELDSLKALANSIGNVVMRTKQSQELKNSLNEKAILLKEVHHRVKNNMQVIASLLKMQTYGLKSQDAKDSIRDSINRVRSMSMVHEKLYQSKDFMHIDFKRYIRSLLRHLLSIYRKNEITLDLKIENIYLNINLAIPCGLIINELVSNSLKYAFSDSKKGKILLSFKYNDENKKYQLSISDNGIGFSKDDIKKNNSLGLTLIESLTDQLHGDLLIDSKKGSNVIITFEKAKLGTYSEI